MPRLVELDEPIYRCLDPSLIEDRLHPGRDRVGDSFREAGVDMQFNFARLVAHAARTRPLAAGTIVGSGTIANEDEGVGASCLAERRMLEIIANGKPETPFMKFGDTIRIEMLDARGRSIFGAIEQVIEPYGG